MRRKAQLGEIIENEGMKFPPCLTSKRLLAWKKRPFQSPWVIHSRAHQ